MILDYFWCLAQFNSLILKIYKNKLLAKIPYSVILPPHEKLELGIIDPFCDYGQMGFPVPWMDWKELHVWHLPGYFQNTADFFWKKRNIFATKSVQISCYNIHL